MPKQEARTARIEARVSPDVLAAIKRAAEIQGRSVSEFIVTAAEDTARRIVEETEVIRLSAEDQRLLAEAIFNPPPPTPALIRAIQHYRRVVKSSE